MTYPHSSPTHLIVPFVGIALLIVIAAIGFPIGLLIDLQTGDLRTAELLVMPAVLIGVPCALVCVLEILFCGLEDAVFCREGGIMIAVGCLGVVWWVR